MSIILSHCSPSYSAPSAVEAKTNDEDDGPSKFWSNSESNDAQQYESDETNEDLGSVSGTAAERPPSQTKQSIFLIV